jgi:hypothetical protein
MTAPLNVSFWQRPRTRLGRWAVSLAAVFIAMWIINTLVFMPMGYNSDPTPWWQTTLLPFYGIFMILCALGGAVLGLIAVISGRERSWLVWLTFLPGAFMLFFLVGEFLFPH